MIQIGATLEEFAAEVVALAAADGAAVLVHLEPLRRDAMLLACAGGPQVPELSDPDAAWRFVAARRSDGGADGCAVVTSTSSCQGQGVLLRLPLRRLLERSEGPDTPVRDDERRRYPRVQTSPSVDGVAWVGIRGARAPERLMSLLGAMVDPDQDRDGDEARLGRFVSMSMRLAWQGYHLSRSLKDPVSQLSGRMEFEIFLQRALAAGRHSGQPLAALLINPDDFVMVNHRFGREAGDQVIREIAIRLQANVRQTDGLFRYGGAAFGVVLPATDLASSERVAHKLRRRLIASAYLDETLALTFSVGGVVADTDALRHDPQPEDMVRRADAALNRAKLSGGATIMLTTLSEPAEEPGHFDPVGGMFTNDTEKDYRNMLLLWEAVSLVSSNPDPDELAGSFVDRLAARFRTDRLVLARSVDGALQVMAASFRDDANDTGQMSSAAFDFRDDERELIDRALASGKLERRQDEGTPADTTAYAVPLTVADKTLGCLFLSGDDRRLRLDSSDVIFLDALVNQLAIALDRAELAASWIREKDRESRQLREQVDELRQAVGPAKLICESAQMQSTLETIRRVAPSAATVLIVGESGTGKEMLARSVHDLSERSKGPYVTVDCGAIAHSLLEAELFGHVKGAYTGAESASDGRILQADGGTLFLDEIGELPLDLQTKLLRFVQEREITPVGGNRTRRVDVRIVAATNRQLKDEVAAGRFRQDLYYRLQVVSVNAVPLRERPSDILPLARFFLGRFAAQHGAPCRELSAAAHQLLVSHDWPGNVRELEHCMLRAVLMADGEILDAADIELLPETREPAGAAAETREMPSAVAPTADPGSTGPAADVDPAAEDAELWRELARVLDTQVADVIEAGVAHPPPLGRWLQQDLVIAAGDACGDVSRRAARLIGLPESTFRRQLDKARLDAATGQAGRSVDWAAAAQLLRRLAGAGNVDGSPDLLETSRLVLLRIVAGRVADDTSLGAALMGITPPTYKRWVARHGL